MLRGEPAESGICSGRGQWRREAPGSYWPRSETLVQGVVERSAARLRMAAVVSSDAAPHRDANQNAVHRSDFGEPRCRLARRQHCQLIVAPVRRLREPSPDGPQAPRVDSYPRVPELREDVSTMWIARVVLLSLIALPFVLAVFRWRRAARWNSSVSCDRAGDDWEGPVWFHLQKPRMGFRNASSKVRGQLSVSPASSTARFVSVSGSESMVTSVRAVDAGRRGSDIVNSWIEVEGNLNESPQTMFVNDAAWFGWRALLTDSNERLRSAFDALTIPNSEPTNAGSEPL